MIPTNFNQKKTKTDDDVHQRAKEVVRKIRTLIDALRLIPAFCFHDFSPNTATATATANNASSSTEEEEEDISTCTITSSTSTSLSLHRVDLYSILSQALALDVHVHVHLEASQSQSQQRCRHRVVQDILMPLCRELCSVYQILDANTNTNANHHPLHSTLCSCSSLLSLQDYTNIACFLELFVCTSILPLACVTHEQSSIQHIINR